MKTMCNLNYGLRNRVNVRAPNNNQWPFSDDDVEEIDYSSDFDPDYDSSRPRRRRRSQPRNGVEIADMEAENSDQPVARRVDGMCHHRPRRQKCSLESCRDGAGLSNNNMNIELTRKRTILSWMIDMKVVEENDVVRCKSGIPDQEGIEGKIKRQGIICSCCSEVVPVWKFEVHAGGESRMPYGNVYLSGTGFSLQYLQSQAWNKDKELIPREFNYVGPQPHASDTHDDVCFICADGGSLLCCGKCPSTVHPSCLKMEKLPQGDWNCPYCVCKSCGGSDGGLEICIQCQKKFHLACCCEMSDFNRKHLGFQFCGNACKRIFTDLQVLVGKKDELGDGFSLSLLRWMETKLDDPHGYQRVECNSKLAVASRVMDECFMTYIDRHTRTNIVQSVVYHRSSNLPRLNFGGFYTVILEKDEEIICAASIRVHERNIAEMPFMATREIYRMQGMAKKLQNAIENILCYVKVKKLIIPSVLDMVEMWTVKYQFSNVDDELNKKLLDMNILMFPGTVRLQKTLRNQEAEPIAENTGGEKMEEVEVTQNLARPVLFDLNLEPPPEEND